MLCQSMSQLNIFLEKSNKIGAAPMAMTPSIVDIAASETKLIRSAFVDPGPVGQKIANGAHTFHQGLLRARVVWNCFRVTSFSLDQESGIRNRM